MATEPDGRDAWRERQEKKRAQVLALMVGGASDRKVLLEVAGRARTDRFGRDGREDVWQMIEDARRDHDHAGEGCAAARCTNTPESVRELWGNRGLVYDGLRTGEKSTARVAERRKRARAASKRAQLTLF